MRHLHCAETFDSEIAAEITTSRLMTPYRALSMAPLAFRPNLLVGTTGISIMTAVAYYRSWSKHIEKTAHAHVSPTVAEKSHAPAGVQLDSKDVVGAA